MAAKSFKQMIKDGDLKRADAMKARLEDLHEEPGFKAPRFTLSTSCASTPRNAEC